MPDNVLARLFAHRFAGEHPRTEPIEFTPLGAETMSDTVFAHGSPVWRQVVRIINVEMIASCVDDVMDADGGAADRPRRLQPFSAPAMQPPHAHCQACAASELSDHAAT